MSTMDVDTTDFDVRHYFWSQDFKLKQYLCDMRINYVKQFNWRREIYEHLNSSIRCLRSHCDCLLQI